MHPDIKDLSKTDPYIDLVVEEVKKNEAAGDRKQYIISCNRATAAHLVFNRLLEIPNFKPVFVSSTLDASCLEKHDLIAEFASGKTRALIRLQLGYYESLPNPYCLAATYPLGDREHSHLSTYCQTSEVLGFIGKLRREVNDDDET